MPPKKSETVEFNVNQVGEALASHFGFSLVQIEGVYVADCTHQWKPDFKRIGAGGVMTIVCEVE